MIGSHCIMIAAEFDSLVVETGTNIRPSVYRTRWRGLGSTHQHPEECPYISFDVSSSNSYELGEGSALPPMNNQGSALTIRSATMPTRPPQRSSPSLRLSLSKGARSILI